MISFIREAFKEIKTVTTPSNKETQSAVIAILIAIFITAIVIICADFVISKIIKLIFGF
jgi:preprotein translocase SecE subunit|tara:strand:- start:21363 stop:21539 length:177 start_codon:yes stop_codon:yes gene_type:complete